MRELQIKIRAENVSKLENQEENDAGKICVSRFFKKEIKNKNIFYSFAFLKIKRAKCFFDPLHVL